MNIIKSITKEYNGDRPCIDPFVMMELRLRCAKNKIKPNPDPRIFAWLVRVWKNLLP